MKNVNPKPAHGYMGKISVLPLYEGMGIEYPTNIEECENFTKLMWPQENDRFCEIAHTYSNIVAELQQLVMRLLFESYGIEKHYERHKESTTYLLRLLKYSKSQTDRTNVALKVHTDKSLVSILHSNHVKGLELRTKDGEWLQFEPSPTSFVVIAGEEKRLQRNHNFDRKVRGVIYDDPVRRDYMYENRSYDKTIKEFKPRRSEAGNVQPGFEQLKSSLSMSWKVSYEEEEWLSRSAVGTLQEFSNVDEVN
ncbi:hypothetical protein QYF36_001607 [Acer negundo]|nr:hypothetical protein QYF36_001607 [Acer negundo]